MDIFVDNYEHVPDIFGKTMRNNKYIIITIFWTLIPSEEHIFFILRFPQRIYLAIILSTTWAESCISEY